MKLFNTFLALLVAVLFSFTSNAHAQTQPPVVHAVLFYSPTCGHCEFVITQTILPMMDNYGEQLQIIGIDVTQPEGQALFLSAIDMFNLEQAGVPFLVIDNIYLIGSTDIPEKFPSLVETYLSHGGIGYPNIPGLQEAMGQNSESETTTPQSSPAPATVSPALPTPIANPGIHLVTGENTANWTDRFANDPIGNTLAVIVLIGMAAAIAWIFYVLRNNRKVISLQKNRAWVIPALSIIGMGIAGYLTYVETTQVTAICGPVGDCNTVQQSQYARLFGILPIGLLGLIGYLVILSFWMTTRHPKTKLGRMAGMGLFLSSLFGTFFSIYLTFLEPFVIGATCMWCLTSAIVMTTLMILTAGFVKPYLIHRNSP